MKKLFFLNIVLFLVISCQTTDKCRLWDNSNYFATFTALQDNENYILSVKFNAKDEPNNIYSDLEASNLRVNVIVKNEDIAIDTVCFNTLYPSGVADKKGNATVTIHGVTEWRNSTAIDRKKLRFTFIIETDEECYYQDVAPQPSIGTKDVITLYPSVNKDTDGTLTFILYAQRNRIKVDEYMPTSEKLRVIIYSEKGEVKWNSAFSRNFLQVVTPVYPKEVGEVYKYSLKWDGYDNHAKLMPPGKYRAQMIIPSKPNSYSESIVFKWKI